MAKEKVTITLDRSLADDARSLVGARSTSEVIQLALVQLIRAERLRRDIAAYSRTPPTQAEAGIGLLAGRAVLEDGTDWEQIYGDDQT